MRAGFTSLWVLTGLRHLSSRRIENKTISLSRGIHQVVVRLRQLYFLFCFGTKQIDLRFHESRWRLSWERGTGAYPG